MQPSYQFIVFDRSREQSRIDWAGERLVIGRRLDVDIQINEPTMSGVHAELVPADDGGVIVRDLNSLNGTQLNGVRVTQSVVEPGDQIQIGRARIVVSAPDGETDLDAGTFLDPETGTTPTDALPPAPRSVDGVDTVLSDTGSQTVKIRLDHLRISDGEELREEDQRILLLRNLFETLKDLDTTEAILEKTREVLARAFARSHAFVFLPDEDGEGWRELEGNPSDRRPSLTFVAETVSSMSAVLSSSLRDDRRFSASESARISGISTAMAAPTSCDGEVVAVLYVDRLGLPPFDTPELNILGIAANHVSAVLENASRITKLRRTNEELVEARETLAELNRNLERLVEERTAEIRRQAEEIHRLADAKDELLGIAAHDIRGPLTVIQGTAELLRLRVEQVDRQTLASSLDMVYHAARGLSRLLSELLDAKAIESGKIKLHRRLITLAELLDAALPAPRLAAEDKQIELEVSLDSDETVHADPQRLGQALTNLVLNAIKFSETGTRITLTGRSTDDGRVELAVTDQGVGIPEDELESVFGTFEQGTSGRQYGGSGLGLMIARRLVELHDGELGVESVVGVGSRFAIRLPSGGAPSAATDAPPASFSTDEDR